MTPNQLPSDGIAMLDAINPVSQGAGAVSTAWINVTNFHSLMALITTGVLGAAATLDAKLQQAQDNAGTGAKDIAGKAITQIVKASGDNKMAMINARAQDLDTTNNFNFVRLTLTVGVAASLVGANLMGVFPRFEPVKDAAASPAINLGSANVVQIV